MTFSTLPVHQRRFVASEHIRSVLHGEWLDMLDDACRPLPGIRGRDGVSAEAAFGQAIGADLIEVQAGRAFPHHVHAGEHILYVVAGQGLVHVDGQAHAIHTGDTIYIPAEYPHSVSNPHQAQALVLLTVGIPHRPVAAPDRMRVVTGDDEPSG
jgi:quercetin dioxygenase-like cupin family protein